MALFNARLPYDGTFGLGPKQNQFSPFYRMLEARIITQPIFSVHLSNLITSNGGQITFGGIDHDRYEGNITWTPILESDKYWSVSLNSASFGDSLLKIQSNVVALDTGIGGILLPAREADEINRMIGATSSPLGQVDCSRWGATPPVTLNIGGTNFTLESEDYILNIFGTCYSAFTKLQAPSLNYFRHKAMLAKTWVLGTPFLRKYYAIFDVGNKRLGLAQASTVIFP